MSVHLTRLTLTSLLVCIGACDALVGDGTPPKGSSGTGGGAGNSGDDDGGVVVDPTIGTGGIGGGPGTDGGIGPDGAGVAASPCGPYPVGPELSATRFEVGTVVPNLVFKREDGTFVSFGELRCDKKNRLMYWAVGGDNCPPCIATAKATEIPAWNEMGAQGLLMLEVFNARRFLVSRSPWTNFRIKTMWPADNESIMLLDEPAGMPYYVFGRVTNGIPWVATVDLETMKVVSRSRGSVTSLRTQLMALPPRQ